MSLYSLIDITNVPKAPLMLIVGVKGAEDVTVVLSLLIINVHEKISSRRDTRPSLVKSLPPLPLLLASSCVPSEEYLTSLPLE